MLDLRPAPARVGAGPFEAVEEGGRPLPRLPAPAVEGAGGASSQLVRALDQALDPAQRVAEPPAPELPDDVVARTTERYRQAYQRLTGATI